MSMRRIEFTLDGLEEEADDHTLDEFLMALAFEGWVVEEFNMADGEGVGSAWVRDGE